MIPAFQRGLRPAWQGSDPPAGGGGINPNLLRWTEEFDNAVWVASGVTVTPNATPPPPGLTRADQLAFDPDSSIGQASTVAATTGALASLAPVISTSWERFSKAGTYDGLPYTYSIHLRGAVGGEPISLFLARVGGFLKATLLENSSAGGTIFVSGAKLEQGSLTDYVHRTT